MRTMSTPDTSILSHLQRMLSLLGEHEWIHAFLFNPDPAHLTCLTAPFLTHHAITCVASITRYSTTVPSPPQHVDASFVFVPAFSVNSISTGFGMQQNDFSTPSTPSFLPLPCEVSHEREQFRFVRDDATGVIVMLYDHPDETFIRMEHISHQSTTCRLRSFCLFDREKFTAIRKSQSILKPETLLHALKLSQIVYEYRNCPYCRKAHGALCGCQLDLVPPRHNLDFRNGIKHMSSHIGTYEGSATLKQIANGIVTDETTLGTRVDVRGGAMPDLVHRLTRWALSQHSRDLPPVNPVPSLLPIAADAEVVVGSDLDFLSFDTVQPVGKQSCSDMRAPESFGPPPIQFLKDVAPDFGANITDRTDFLSELFSANISCGDIGLQDLPVAKLFGWRADSFGMQSNIPDPEQVIDINRFLETEQGGVAADEEAPAPAPAKRMRHSSDIAVEKSESATTLEKETCVEQNENDSEHGGDGRILTQEEEEALRVKEQKRQQKIMRNRASARRSNEKKKRENDARKRLKRELQERVVELRAKEMRLRAENLQLRNLVSSVNGNGKPPFVCGV